MNVSFNLILICAVVSSQQWCHFQYYFYILANSPISWNGANGLEYNFGEPKFETHPTKNLSLTTAHSVFACGCGFMCALIPK